MDTRLASPADASLLSSLCVTVQELHAKRHPEVFVTPSGPDFAEDFFASQLADPLTHIFIAEENGTALGYILCKLTERPTNAFTHEIRFLLIDQISVLPESRGKGAGAALIERTRVLARELGVKQIRLDTWDFNTKAHGFFEHEGFTRFIHRYWLNLG
jgi:GNAT superfamily N-acetyltransferase